MQNRSSKRPSDLNQLAKLTVDIASGDVKNGQADQISKKNPAAVALGRLGGKKGGAARAARLTSEQRSEMAKKAAQVRWAARVNK